MIEVAHISKMYGKKQNMFAALSDVSFTIADGATVAIVGKSGSGKSTLMHAMSGLDRPQSGNIVIDGQDMLTFTTKEVDRFRSKEMAFIFQSFFVEGNESCYNNVSLPLEIARVPQNERNAKITKALKAVELEHKSKSKAKDLSGGEKQRLAIARAIVNEPAILFADEPTGNLDSVTGDTIEKLLFSYNRKNKTTLIIVTHDLDLAKKCDMQIYIKDGSVQRVLGSKQ